MTHKPDEAAKAKALAVIEHQEITDYKMTFCHGDDCHEQKIDIDLTDLLGKEVFETICAVLQPVTSENIDTIDAGNLSDCIDFSEVDIPKYEDMTREELIESLRAHDAHHQEHHDREDSLWAAAQIDLVTLKKEIREKIPDGIIMKDDQTLSDDIIDYLSSRNLLRIAN